MQNDNKEKKTFKEMWHDKRMHAIIVLGMWFIFFVFIFIFLAVASLFNNTNSNSSEIEEKKVESVTANIPKMLEILIGSDYDFEISINNNNNMSYSYTGSKEQEVIKGYYENNNEIVKYMIKDNNYYQLEGENIIESDNIITDEDKNNIDLNNLLNILKNYENNNEVIYNENKYIYEISETYKITIYTVSNNIKEIIINYNEYIYDLTFKNIVNN